MWVHTDFAQLVEDLAPEDVRGVLTVFVTDLRQLASRLAAAAAAGDPVAFRRIAHGLAGAAGAVGAGQLDRACRSAMVRTDLEAAHLPAMAALIDRLAQGAVEELAVFVSLQSVSMTRG